MLYNEEIYEEWKDHVKNQVYKSIKSNWWLNFPEPDISKIEVTEGGTGWYEGVEFPGYISYEDYHRELEKGLI